MNNTRLPKTACVQARQLGARNVLDEGQRTMEKHNMKYDEVKVCDMTKNQWKRTVDRYVRKSTNTDITRKTREMKKLQALSDETGEKKDYRTYPS